MKPKQWNVVANGGLQAKKITKARNLGWYHKAKHKSTSFVSFTIFASTLLFPLEFLYLGTLIFYLTEKYVNSKCDKIFRR